MYIKALTLNEEMFVAADIVIPYIVGWSYGTGTVPGLTDMQTNELKAKIQEWVRNGEPGTLQGARNRNPFTSEVAHTSGTVITLNTRKKRSVAKWIATIGHEITHLLGYSHPFHASKERDNSVSYLFGDMLYETFKADYETVVKKRSFLSGLKGLFS